ncbi:hypothetical protein [Vibrio sp. 10N.261.51.F12]|uniref:hypothetical protein n=1 Tax=Vibrio sp. 10N.261.51.F12 TaxID=3229679 RepID=UPI003552EA16
MDCSSLTLWLELPDTRFALALPSLGDQYKRWPLQKINGNTPPLQKLKGNIH